MGTGEVSGERGDDSIGTTVTPSVLLPAASTGIGLGTLDTYTMEHTVFPETFTLMPMSGTLPCDTA